jgi:CelD/BcsL family acetyltransferase involved in cellulose biosynthesis
MSHRRDAWSVEIAGGVEPFEAEWSALVGPGDATPFQNFGFMRLFFRLVAARRPDEPVVALVRHPDGRPAAIFPMLRSRRHGLGWLRTDARPVDYCAPIFDPTVRPAEAGAIARAVLAAVPGADVLYCNRMPATFGEVANPLAALPNAGRLRLSAWVLRLAGRSRAEVVATQTSKFRRHLRRSLQNLAKAHAHGFTLSVGEAIGESEIADFRALRAESAEHKARANIFEEPEWRDLYRGLLDGRAAPLRPWLSRLEADGAPIAVLFGFTDGRRAVAIMTASKTDHRKVFAPGLLLFDETIARFQTMGTDFFDLSIGDMAYKRRFGCDEIPLHDALFARGLRGRLYYVLWKTKIAIRARMKKISQD